MKPDVLKLRLKYMNNPPEGLSSDDIRRMSEDDLLDMDYFLNEDLYDEFGEDGFYIFQIRFISLLFCPLFRGLFYSRVRR